MAGPDDTAGLPTSGAATAVAERPPTAAPPASDGFSVRSMSPGLVGAAIRGGIEKQRDLTAKEEQGRVEMNGIKVPEIPKMPEPPKESMTDFATMFGSAAMGIASIGSLMTRRPMIHALEASTGVMKAFHAGDLERSKQAFEQWKIATENATRMHQFEMDNFHAIMEKAKGNQDILRSELTGLAAATKNDAALALLNAGDTAGAVHLFTGIDALGKKMTEGQLRVQDDIEKRHDLMAAQAKPPGPERDAALTAVRQKWTERAQVDDPLAWEKAQATKPVNATVETPDGQKTMAVLRAANGVFTDLAGQPLPGKIVQMGVEKQGNASTQKEAELTTRARDDLVKELNRPLTDSVEDQALIAKTKQRLREEDVGATATARTAATVKQQQEAALLTPDAKDLLAKQYLRTGQLPPMGMGAAANAMKSQVLDLAAKIAKDEGHSIEDYVEGRATLKADAASLTQATKMYDSVHSYEATALDNLKVVEDAMTKGAGTAAGPVINRWYLAGKKATGDKDVAALDTALGAFRGEFAKIMSGSTGSVAAASDSARAEADKMIDGGQSPDALKAQIAVARKDMENRKVNLRKQVEDIQKRLRGGSIAASEGGDTPEISEAQYNALPAGAHYRVPGDPTVRIKP